MRVLTLLIFILLLTFTSVSAQNHAHKKPLSPPDSAEVTIGSTNIKINYSSPRVRGRIVWGGLVALDRIWSAGAHDATRIFFSQDVKINGSEVKAGTYGFFIIPGKETWILIINKNYEQHLADDYDESLDVLRFQVTPILLEESKEELTYALEGNEGGNGIISLTWDKLRVQFSVQIN